MNEFTKNIENKEDYVLVVANNPLEEGVKGIILYNKINEKTELKIFDKEYENVNLEHHLTKYMYSLLHKLNLPHSIENNGEGEILIQNNKNLI